MDAKLAQVQAGLETMAGDVLLEKLNDLQSRHHILFRWLRVKWLLRKLKYAKAALA